MPFFLSPALILASLLSLGTLCAGTCIAWSLSKLYPNSETIRKVLIIVRSWWIILGTFLAGMAFGKFGLAVLFYVLTLYIAQEYLTISSLHGMKKSLYFNFLVATTLQYGFLTSGNSRLYYASAPLLIACIAPALIIFKTSVDNLGDVFAAISGMLLVSYWLSYVPALPILIPQSGFSAEQAMLSVVLLVLLVECNDIFQFLSGKLFGRHKIFPQISPNKTGAGFIGGLLLTTGLGAFAASRWLQLNLGQGASLGLLVSIAGVLGDLFFSAMKRHFKVKDFSAAIPGHGGVIDRLDSLIIAAPFYFHALLLLKDGKI